MLRWAKNKPSCLIEEHYVKYADPNQTGSSRTIWSGSKSFYWQNFLAFHGVIVLYKYAYNSLVKFVKFLPVLLLSSSAASDVSLGFSWGSFLLSVAMTTEVNNLGWKRFNCCSFSGLEDKVAEYKSFWSYDKNEKKNKCIFVQSHRKGTISLLHSERPKLYTILAFLSAIGLRC